MASTVPPSHTPSGPPNTIIRNVVIGFLLICVVAGYTGQALVGNLATRHPLLLITLNARSTFLVLASGHLTASSYYVVGFIRLMVADPVFFILGHWYGDAGVKWMERKSPTYGKMLRTSESWFAKAAYPLIAIAPNSFFCVFAGASGMNVAGFFVVSTLGTLVRLYILRRLGKRFSHGLSHVTHWLYSHWLIVAVVMIVLIAISLWSERKASGESGLSQLVHLDATLGSTMAAEEVAAAMIAESRATSDGDGGSPGSTGPPGDEPGRATEPDEPAGDTTSASDRDEPTSRGESGSPEPDPYAETAERID